MKRRPLNFPLLYQKALRAHLELGPKADPESASGLGIQASKAGLKTLDLAKLHEKTLVMDLLPAYPAAKQNTIIKQAGLFFAAAIAPPLSNNIELEAAHLKTAIWTLSDRTVELAAANQLLSLEIVHRKKVEASLKRSESHNLKSLEKSNLLKEQLRELSRKVLSAQEVERKKISRELHDVIAQALMGINVRLAALKSAAGSTSKSLNRNIAITQKVVTKSSNIVNQFACELRPTALDDLGLVPALTSFMKNFTEQTGVRTYLTAFAALERLSSSRRTALYRVAQEALTNVARHAHASQVHVTISKEPKSVRMVINDDGRSFQVESVLIARGRKRLGLLGMRERVEMLGGVFHIESVPGTGTKITALIPVTKTTGKIW
jgi:signal transduction histidine kinase